MFEKKKCEYCGRKVKKDFKFCPYCGRRLRERIGIFEYIHRKFKILDKFFDEEFEFPEFDNWKGGGIFVKIESGRKPKIEIRTSGEYKKLEPEIRRRIGIKPKIEEVESERKIRKIKKVEEPKTEVKDLGNKKIIKISLPGVKDEKDLEIKRLSQSIEIKGFAKDKIYFTLIPIPQNCSITKRFKNGILKIEIEKF